MVVDGWSKRIERQCARMLVLAEAYEQDGKGLGELVDAAGELLAASEGLTDETRLALEDLHRSLEFARTIELDARGSVFASESRLLVADLLGLMRQTLDQVLDGVRAR